MANPRQLKFVMFDAPPNRVELPPSGEVAVTVRLGAKWQKAGTGEVVELWECDHHHDGDCPYTEPGLAEANGECCLLLAHAKLLGWWAGEFNDLPRNLLMIEHSYKARFIEGLAKQMHAAYGEAFTEDAQVTALIFQVL